MNARTVLLHLDAVRILIPSLGRSSQAKSRSCVPDANPGTAPLSLYLTTIEAAGATENIERMRFPVEWRKIRREWQLLLGQVFPQLTNPVFQLVAGFEEIRGVVNHVGSHEQD